MYSAIYPILGAVISRWHGGGFYQIPKSYINIIWALPFAYAMWLYNPWLAPLTFALCLLKSVGHGQYFDLGTMPHNGKPERIDFIVKFITFPVKRKITAYWYDVAGMTVKGFVAVSGTLLLIPYNPLLALSFAVCGMISSIGYMIGWKLWPSPKSTEFGELWTGFFAFLPFILI